jgi:biopolymer transport protein ExbD
MAGIDVPQGNKRDLNREVNMIPFIDLLMVTVMFLLMTAVWIHNARIEASVQVPGNDPCTGDCTGDPQKDLHVYVGERDFTLTWKQGSTSLSERRVPLEAGDRYDALAAAIADEWRESGAHRDVADRAADRCVVHTDNRLSFGEMVRVLDAIYDAKRDVIDVAGARRPMSVFSAALAAR